MVIETERLRLREYTHEDFPALFEIFSDPETLRHYPKPFDEKCTKDWIEWNIPIRRTGFHMPMLLHAKNGVYLSDRFGFIWRHYNELR